MRGDGFQGLKVVEGLDVLLAKLDGAGFRVARVDGLDVIPKGLI